MSAANQRLIDVHHHVVPDFYRRCLQDAGLASPIPGVEYPRWHPDASLEMLDALNASAAVVSVTEPGVYFADAQRALRLARRLNEYLAGLLADHPDRFGAFAVLPLPDIDAALAEIEYALDTLGLDGVGLLTNYRGAYVGDAALDPVLAELNRRKVPVFLHPARPANAPQTFGLPLSLYEFPFDTSRTLANLLYSGALDRHSDLRLIAAHGGGALPFLAGRLADGAVISPALADRAPRDAIGAMRRLYLDTALVASPYALPSLHALAKPTNVLFGSDFPFLPARHAQESWERLSDYHAADLATLHGIAEGNAIPLFPRLERVEAASASPSATVHSETATPRAVANSRRLVMPNFV
jgi:predicted TIM-barrel fold metal-dependent hydrolase